MSEIVFECAVVLPFSWKVLLDVLTLFLPVVYNVGMKKQQEEMTIEFMDELDLSRVPKDIFDAFLEALEEAFEEVSVKYLVSELRRVYIYLYTLSLFICLLKLLFCNPYAIIIMNFNLLFYTIGGFYPLNWNLVQNFAKMIFMPL